MVKISIIVPVRNEEDNIQRLCESIHASMTRDHLTYEIIMIDDHSTDKSAQLVSRLKKTYPLQFITKAGVRGKGQSILEGTSYAKGDIVCMIDADLQYSPKHIPEMLKKLQDDKEAGVVVAYRKDYRAGSLRKFGSRFNAFLVGTLLFGLHVDIQSGLKVFRKEIVEHIDPKSVGPWSFDIPLLHTARELGFSIAQIPITFDNRIGGESKVRFVKVAHEIATNAVKLRLSRPRVYHVKPHDGQSMIGAGIIHKKKRYITHSTLSHHNSAIKTLHGWQQAALISAIGLFALCLSINIINTIVIAFALLNGLYFFDVFFNLYMTMRTLKTDTEISSTDEEIAALTDKELPIYTVLCPLYKEAHIIPQFVEAMSKLEWPKAKLDVMLLLEEDDPETIEAAENLNLPSFVRIVVVPHSFPKTKPKATNYGLAYAKGEFVVIYDAEDIPDPLQLKKAYLGFQKSPKHVVCLQAKLNYYNPHQNLLTRIFTAEYSLWFDLILPGLQSIEAPLPLGGTSNHFRVGMLTELEGWDSFNVTEDCDLGIRLAKYGYQTAIIDSVTMEEANSKLGNWINQRSRWIKGYIQSYLVHMRFPRKFFKENRRDFFLFQLVVGGKILALFINPIMWILTITYFASRAHLGIYIEKLFPGPLLYMAVFSLVVGNFVYLYYYMIACAKRGHFSLIKFVYIVPFYWLAMSVAGYKALSELFYKPHFWQKTTHGLHLAKQPFPASIEEEVELAHVQTVLENKISHKIEKKRRFSVTALHIQGASLVFAMGIGSILNFLYSAYLGRILGFEDFALIGLIGGLLSLTSIISSAFSTTVNYKTGYLSGKYGEEQAIEFWQKVRRVGYIINFGTTLLWIFVTPFLITFFNTSDFIPWVLFAPVILLSLVSAADRGFLAGKLRFGALGIMQVIEPIIKLSVGIAFVYLGLQFWAYAAVPISVVCIFFVGWFFARKEKPQLSLKTPQHTKFSFPIKFYMMCLFTGCSLIFFTSVDVLLAKHYLSPLDAGKYSLLVLAGKMIFFMGAFASPFVTPLVSRNEGKNRSSITILHYTLIATIALALFGFVIFGIFGQTTIPLLYGSKAHLITNHILIISAALVLFTISKVFSDYYLVKKNFIFPFFALILCSFQVLLLFFFHNSVESFVYIMSAVWSTHLVMNVILHMNISKIERIEHKIISLVRNFGKVNPEHAQKGELSILVYNWRDITHTWAGGAEVYIHELAKRWVEEGHSVTLFCGSPKGKPSRDNIDGVQIFRHGRFHTVYIWAFIYYIFKFRGKYDIIIDCENGIPFFTPWYTKEKKFLLVHHVHQEVFRKSLRWPLAQIALFLEAKVMPLAYRNVPIITVSPSSKDEILKHKLTKGQPHIVYNGVDLDKFVPAKKSTKPLVVYLGRLQYYKSLNIFIKAAQEILKVNPDVEFVIAGEGEERKRLQKFADKLGLSNNIQFTGKVSDEEKIKLFQKAWVFVNPSFMEGWGITTIEANACGTPAVASNVPGLRDSVNNAQTGFLVTYGNHQKFAQHIIKLIENHELRGNISENARKWAQEFSWDKSAQDFMEIILKDSVQNYALQHKHLALQND